MTSGRRGRAVPPLRDQYMESKAWGARGHMDLAARACPTRPWRGELEMSTICSTGTIGMLVDLSGLRDKH
jgi:hypothetical protein